MTGMPDGQIIQSRVVERLVDPDHLAALRLQFGGKRGILAPVIHGGN